MWQTNDTNANYPFYLMAGFLTLHKISFLNKHKITVQQLQNEKQKKKISC